jgi:hypothetical protein
MASWSAKRKYGYFFALVLFLAAAIGLPVFLTLYKAPTCSDGKQNGSERGIDCGGACTRLCPADFASPRVLWSYSMNIVPGVYNTMAYVQNPNQNVEVKSITYLFKLYDDQGILVAQREGATFIPAGQKFAVFEGGIRTGERIPARTTFEFTDLPIWRVGTAVSKIKVLSVDVDQGSSPKAEVRIKNDAVDQGFSNVDAFVILYDKDDNRVAFSKTVIEKIAPSELQTLYFTWPMAFPKEIVRTEALFVVRPSN